LLPRNSPRRVSTPSLASVIDWATPPSRRSERGNPPWKPHGAPNSVASRTPAHGVTGIGSRQRRSPMGGCANGIPLKTAPPFSSVAPCTCPPVTATTGPDSAATADDMADMAKNVIPATSKNSRCARDICSPDDFGKIHWGISPVARISTRKHCRQLKLKLHQLPVQPKVAPNGSNWPVADVRGAGPSVRNPSKFRHQWQARLKWSATVARIR
jgi:hypothetical protein